MICKCGIVLFPAVFTLGDPRVYVGILYSSNEIANVKTPIDKVFSFITTLSISDIYPNDHYV